MEKLRDHSRSVCVLFYYDVEDTKKFTALGRLPLRLDQHQIESDVHNMHQAVVRTSHDILRSHILLLCQLQHYSRWAILIFCSASLPGLLPPIKCHAPTVELL